MNNDVIELPDGSRMNGDKQLYRFKGELVQGKAIIPDGVEDIKGHVFGYREEMCSEYGGAYYLGSKENPYKYLYGIMNSAWGKARFEGFHPDTEYICQDAFYRYGDSRQGFAHPASKLVLPPKLKGIGEKAFYNAEVDRIYVPEGCKRIGAEAFKVQYRHPTIILPASIETIGKAAFTKDRYEGYDYVIAPPAVLALIGKNFLVAGFRKYLDSHERTAEKDGEWLSEIKKSRTTFVNSAIADRHESSLLFALQYNLTKAAEYEKILSVANESQNAELIAAALATKNKPTEKQIARKEKIEEDKAFGLRKLSIADIKKLWTYREDYDGNITLERYIGNEAMPTIPQTIGKAKVVRLGKGAFYRSDVESVIIPEGIVAMGSRVFEGCQKLTSVVFPSSLTMVGNDVFFGCVNLKTLPALNENQVRDAEYQKQMDYCNKDDIEWRYSIDARKNSCTILSYEGDKKEIEIPAYILGIPVRVIGDTCFSATGRSKGPDKYKNLTIKSVVIPDTVVEIRREAFNVCKQLKTIAISNSVVRIGDHAFKGCRSLKSIVLPDTVTHIGEGAFQDCVALKSVVIPKRVKYLHYAFEGCSALTSVVLPTDAKILCGTFKGCSALKSVTIPDKVVEIAWAFQGCSALESIVLPDSVTKILDDAFSGCSALKSVTIPDSVTEIRDRAFQDCVALKSVVIPAGCFVVSSAFDGCKDIKIIRK